MAKAGMLAGKLTVLKVENLTKPGTYGDGNGLYLQVTAPAGDTKKRTEQTEVTSKPRKPARSWLFRFKRGGRTRWAGLGSYPTVSLAKARQAAADARKVLAAGGDPIEAKRTERAEAAAGADRTFQAVAEMYVAEHEAGWRNPKHRQQWRNTLKEYAFPKLGDKQVAVVTCLAHVLRDKTEAAYQRGDMLEKRRRLMGEWAGFCARPAAPQAEVVALRG
jgi:hypothetical protein